MERNMEKDVKDLIRPEKRDGVTQQYPILGRKYTMTHSDETAERFVTIGKQYAMDQISPTRDEVLMEIIPMENCLVFYGTVLVDSPNSNEKNGAEFRNNIFLREMPVALQAIRYADNELFQYAPMLDEIPVHLWFQSEKDEYNKVYDFGTMKDYIISSDRKE